MPTKSQENIPEIDTLNIFNSDYQKHTKDSGFIERFFWWCAGVPIFVLQKKPTEHTKYFCIGMAVFTTAIAAFLSGSYAIFQAFEGKPMALGVALGIGALWALMIFNLDRFIVQSMRAEASIGNKILTAAPRLILAILIGLSISKPLEIQFFEKEINEYLFARDHKKANEHYEIEVQNATKFAKERIPVLRGLVDKAWVVRENARSERDTESEGLVKKSNSGTVTGSGVYGKGINWAQKNNEFNKQDKAYKEIKDKNEAEIQTLEAVVNTFVQNRETLIKKNF